MKKLVFLSLVFIFISGCIQLEAPKVTYLDARVSKVTLEGAQIEFLFEIQNKNPIPLEIGEYAYKIYINERELLSESQKGFSLPANETQKISLPIFVRYDRVFDSVLNIAVNILAGKLYFDYKVEGSISAGAMGFTVSAPLNAAGRVNIPKEYLKI